MLDIIRITCVEDGSSSSDNGIFWNLLLVLSVGRCKFGESEKKVREQGEFSDSVKVNVMLIDFVSFRFQSIDGTHVLMSM